MARLAMPLSFNSDGAANTAAAQSSAMTADVYSKPVDVSTYGRYGFHFIWADGATPVGNLYLQFSYDGTTWIDSGVAALAVSGDTGSHVWEREAYGETYARVFFDFSSGDATVTGFFGGRTEA
jgi:hypothetical protein